MNKNNSIDIFKGKAKITPLYYVKMIKGILIMTYILYAYETKIIII